MDDSPHIVVTLQLVPGAVPIAAAGRRAQLARRTRPASRSPARDAGQA